jgi:hypothetical protein
MARPRYGAAKRAREIRKQEERARKLARKHGRAAAKAAGAETVGTDETPPAETPATVPAEDTPQTESAG